MTQDVPDETFLRANRLHRFVTEDDIARARQIQELERAAGDIPRSLMGILQDEGVLDAAIQEQLQPLGGAQDTRTSILPNLPRVLLGNADSSMLEMTPVKPRRPVPAPSAQAPLEAGAPPPDRPAPDPAGTPTPRSRIVTPPEVVEASKDARNRLNQFVLLKEVGKGGMGTVYRAWDHGVGRYVALKLLHDTSQESVDRFIREAHLAGRLSHPSIATVYGVEHHENRYYIEMQFIDGEPIGRRPRTVRQTLTLIRDAARALHYAHHEGVVHRDIKPGNLLVTRDEKIYITDFGLAKRMSGEAVPKISLTGSAFGTPDYMSPEQAQGKARIDARSDVYSLGVTLYTLLAGRSPFREKNIVDLLVAVVEQRPPPLRALNSVVSPELEAAIEKAMAKNPAERFSSAAAFAEELDRLLREGRFVGRYGLAKFLFRKWWLAAAAGVVIGTGIRWGLPALTRSLQEPPDPSHVPPQRESPFSLYRAASTALGRIESKTTLPVEERRSQLSQEVFSRVDLLLERDPQDLRARVLKLRALYIAGRESEVAQALQELADQRKRDYRISFLQSLLDLSKELSQPPLPALEAPFADWEAKHHPWSGELVARLHEVQSAAVDGWLAEEYARDGPAVRGLIHLVESNWELAATALGEVSGQQPLPVYARAWVRAAYMAGHFPAVSASPASIGRREHLGAGMALAARSESPEEAFGNLLPEAQTDPEAALRLRAVLARLAARGGKDPEPQVTSGLALSAGTEGWERELRGILLSTRLSWRALSGRDPEALYQEVFDLLSGSPQGSWMGRAAWLEAKLGLATRLVRRGSGAAQILSEVRTRANAMSELARDWDVPRIQRGLALLREGKLLDAQGELGIVARDLRGSAGSQVRALLASSSVWLAVAEDHRRNRASAGEEATESRNCAMAVLGSYPDHPEALNLAAAAALVLAEEAAGRREGERELVEDALEKLDRALAAVPDFVSALTHRAIAHHLRAQKARAEGKDADPEGKKSLLDLDRALSLIPELGQGLYLRGIVHFSRREYPAARDDWKALVEQDPRWAGELEEWIRQSEARQKR